MQRDFGSEPSGPDDTRPRRRHRDDPRAVWTTEEEKHETQHCIGRGPFGHGRGAGRMGGERHHRGRLFVLRPVRRHLRAHHAAVQGGASRHRREVPGDVRQLRGRHQHHPARGGRRQAARHHVPGSQPPGAPRREGNRQVAGAVHRHGSGLLQGGIPPGDARSGHVRRRGPRTAVRGLPAGGLLQHGRPEKGRHRRAADDLGRGRRELREAARGAVTRTRCSGAGTSPATGSSRRCCGVRTRRSSRTARSTSTAPRD